MFKLLVTILSLSKKGQTIHFGKVLREFVALFVLHVQFYLRCYCAVEQAMAMGRQELLVRLSASGKIHFQLTLNIANFLSTLVGGE